MVAAFSSNVRRLSASFFGNCKALVGSETLACSHADKVSVKSCTKGWRDHIAVLVLAVGVSVLFTGSVVTAVNPSIIEVLLVVLCIYAAIQGKSKAFGLGRGVKSKAPRNKRGAIGVVGAHRLPSSPASEGTTRWYNQQIGAAAKSKQWLQALELWEQMQSTQDGSQPDGFTYCAMISVFVKAHHPEKALIILEEMLRLGFQPDVITYNTLLNACEGDNRFQKASQLFEDMQKQGVLPCVSTYNTMISLSLKSK